MTDSPIADAVAAIASLDPVIGDVDRWAGMRNLLNRLKK
jgi:Ni,Fe-hydrogenase III large subunit